MKTALRKLALGALFLSAPVLGADDATPKLDSVEEKDLLAGKVARDPAAGYIFIQAPYRIYGTFLRVPDDATRAEYQKDWNEAFAKAQRDYVGKLRNWEAQVSIARQTKSALPPRPEEPTRETFRIQSIELRDHVAYGPMFAFNKGEGRFAYLNAVKPGTYIYYGTVLEVPGQPISGYCTCMGTIKFEVKPGTITDLGNSLFFAAKPSPPYGVQTQAAMRYAEQRAAKGKPPLVPKQDVAFGLPSSLRDWPSMQVEYHASGKINNYFGVFVSRMPEIPGVLGYRRDTVIDLRTGQDVESATIYTQVRRKN